MDFRNLALQDDKVTQLYEIPFLDRMGFVFIICVVGMYIISKIDAAKGYYNQWFRDRCIDV